MVLRAVLCWRKKNFWKNEVGRNIAENSETKDPNSTTELQSYLKSSIVNSRMAYVRLFGI